MVKITIKYERKDFFGAYIYSEDTTEPRDAETAVKMANKAFKLVFANDVGLEINRPDGENLIAYQDYSDREKDVVTVKCYHAINVCDTLKVSTSQARKLIKAICTGGYIA